MTLQKGRGQVDGQAVGQAVQELAWTLSAVSQDGQEAEKEPVSGHAVLSITW